MLAGPMSQTLKFRHDVERGETNSFHHLAYCNLVLGAIVCLGKHSPKLPFYPRQPLPHIDSTNMLAKCWIFLPFLFAYVNACRYSDYILCCNALGRQKIKTGHVGNYGILCCLEFQGRRMLVVDYKDRIDKFCDEAGKGLTTTTHRNGSSFEDKSTVLPTEPYIPSESLTSTKITSTTKATKSTTAFTTAPNFKTTTEPDTKGTGTTTAKEQEKWTDRKLITVLLYSTGAAIVVILLGIGLWSCFACCKERQRGGTVDTSGRYVSIPPAGTIENTSEYAFVSPREAETLVTTSRSAERQQLLKQIHRLQMEKANLEKESQRRSRNTTMNLSQPPGNQIAQPVPAAAAHDHHKHNQPIDDESPPQQTNKNHAHGPSSPRKKPTRAGRRGNHKSPSPKTNMQKDNKRYDPSASEKKKS